MNKEQILSSLKSLRDQLPQDIVNSNYVSVEQIMRDLINEEEEEKRVLNEVKSTPEVKRLSSDYRTINSDFEDYVEMLAANEKEIAYMESEVELDKGRIARATRNLEASETEEEKQKYTKEIEGAQSDYEKEKKELEELKEERKSLITAKNTLKQKLNAAVHKLNEAQEKAEKISREDKEKRRSAIEQNVKAYKSKLGFISTNLYSTLDELIINYENGTVNRNEVNRVLGEVKSKIDENPNIINYELEENSIINEQLEILDEQILDLERKVANPNNYSASDTQIERQLAERTESLRRLRKNYNRQRRTFNNNQELLNDPFANLDDKKKKRIEASNLQISSRMKDREKEIEKLESEIEKIKNSKGKVNTSQKSNDEKKLKDLQNNKNNLLYLRDIHEISIDDRLNVLLVATGSKDLNNINTVKESKPKVEEASFPKLDPSEVLIPFPELNSDEKLDNNEMDTIEESKRVAPLAPTAVLGYEEPKLVIKKGGKLKRILATAALALVAIGLGAPYISNLIPKTSMPTPTPTPVEIVEEYEQEEEKQTPTPTPKITPIPEESTKPNRPSSGGNSDKDDEHGVDNNPIITPDPTPGETPAPEINLKPGDRFVQENEGGSRETLVDQNGNVIVEEKGNGNNLPNNDINVLDPNQGTGSGTLENDNPNLTEEAGNEGLKETVEDDISSGKFDDLFSALNSPDEVDIDAYSVQAEEPVAKVAQPQINQEETPTIYTQDQLDQIIYDVLNGSGPTM